MFCYKCGAKINDNAVFCHKCGTKVKDIETSESSSTDSEPRNENPGESTQENQAHENNDSSGKTRERNYKGLLALVAVTVILLISVLSWPGDADYEEIVKTYTPYPEVSYTYADVFERYIKSPKWKTHKTEDGAVVDVYGKLYGMKQKITITIDVSYDSETPGEVAVYPTSVLIDNKGEEIQESASDFVNMMFVAYNNGYNDLSAIYQVPPKKIKLGPVQNIITLIILVISIIVSSKIVNKLQQMYMSLMGASMMFYSRKKKGFAIFIVAIVVFSLLMAPLMSLWGY